MSSFSSAPPVAANNLAVRGRPINIFEFENYARTYLPKQVYDYYRSGSNDEITLKENCEAFNRLILRPRFMINVSQMDITTTILGSTISSPICFSPTAMQRMAHVDGEIASAKAAERIGNLFCLSSLSTTHLEEVAKATPNGFKWFQLYIYKDRSITRSLISQAEKSGYKAIVLTIDTPFIGNREWDVRNGFALPKHLSLANFTQRSTSTDIITDKGTGVSGLAEYSASLFDRTIVWKDIEWLRLQTKLPIILKGILTREDAALACSHGINGILVSNHGARQVDTVASTIDSLPDIVEAVGGRCEVYLDGGIRRGTDIFKALALGARAVFIGRPILWGLSYGGEEGAFTVAKILENELLNTMGLCGTPKITDIKREFVTTKEEMRRRAKL